MVEEVIRLYIGFMVSISNVISNNWFDILLMN